MRLSLLTAVATCLVGCSGPAAPDAAVCRDVIHRLCIAPRCAVTDSTLALTAKSDCEAVLLKNTGCTDEAFTFVSRDAFLSCRLPLVRASDTFDAAPDCNDVDDMFRSCPSMATFLRGGVSP